MWVCVLGRGPRDTGGGGLLLLHWRHVREQERRPGRMWRIHIAAWCCIPQPACLGCTMLPLPQLPRPAAPRRSAEELAGRGRAGGAPMWKRKLRRLLALAALAAALAVYLDRDLQRQLDAALHRWVLGRHTTPELHGEL